jgi:PilZ domain
MTERRKKQRFPVQRPVVLKPDDAGSGWKEIHGVSQKVSDNGVLVLTDRVLPIGHKVRIHLSLLHGVSVNARGKVVRVDHRPDNGCLVAIECSEPLSDSLPDNSPTPIGKQEE